LLWGEFIVVATKKLQAQTNRSVGSIAIVKVRKFRTVTVTVELKFVEFIVSLIELHPRIEIYPQTCLNRAVR
jgi:hypothetical protein